MSDSSDIDRRAILATLGATTGAVLAGCLGDGDDSSGDTPVDTPTPSSGGTPEPTATPTPQTTDTMATATDEPTDTPTREPTATPLEELPGEDASWLPDGVDQQLYELDADFSKELCQQMSRRGPEDDASSTTCEFLWDAEVVRESRECEAIAGGDAEACDCVMKLTSVSVSMTCRVRMPTWVAYPEADESARAEWERFLGQLRQHQQGHLDIGTEYLERMRTTLEEEFLDETYEADGPKGQACEDARTEFLEQVEQRFEALVAEYESAQRQYDEETNDGETQGAELNCSK